MVITKLQISYFSKVISFQNPTRVSSLTSTFISSGIRGIDVNQNTNDVYWVDNRLDIIAKWDKSERFIRVLKSNTTSAPLSSPYDVSVNPETELLVWTEEGREEISSYNNSEGYNVIIKWFDEPVRLETDLINRKLYWSDNDRGTIHRSDLDGGNMETLQESKTSGYVSDMAIDPYNNILYWIDTSYEDIFKYEIKTKRVTKILDSGIDGATGIAFNPIDQKLYVANRDDANIFKVNTDGSLFQIILDSRDGLSYVEDIEIDTLNNRIIWTERGSGVEGIKAADFDGNNIRTLARTGIEDPVGVAIDKKGTIYWTDPSRDRIESLGRYIRTVLVQSRLNPYDIEIGDSYNIPPIVSNINIDVQEDSSLYLKSNDFKSSFSDITGDTLNKVIISTLPTNGYLIHQKDTLKTSIQLNISEMDSLVYLPLKNYFGNDTFYWNGSDGELYAEDSALVIITVTNVNDAPFFVKEINDLEIETNSSDSVFIWDFVQDVENADSLLIYSYDVVPREGLTIDYDPKSGQISIVSSSTIQTYSVQITAEDLDGASATDTLSVNVIEGISSEILTEIPQEFSLSQNYPNPFNPTTNIQFGLPEDADVKLTVYNMLGQVVSELVNDRRTAGFHTVTFDARSLASGIYIYQIEAGAFTQTKKLTLIK